VKVNFHLFASNPRIQNQLNVAKNRIWNSDQIITQTVSG
jgi:hypothetical protein